MLTVFVGTGLRYSELTALQVRDIDLNAKPRPTLRVRRAWKLGADNRYYLGPPKSRAGRRTMGLNNDVTEALRPHLIRRDPTDFVFRGPRTPAWRHSSFHELRWVPALKAALKRGLNK